MEGQKKWAFIFLIVFSISFAFAEFSIDINGLKTESYATGEDLTFNIILLEENTKINQEVQIEITDIQNTKTTIRTYPSNQEQTIPIEKDWKSGIWTIKAKYQNEEIERTFNIEEQNSINFEIKDTKLIIKNTGNTRYQKSIQLTIGDTKQSKTLNIPVGEQKEWQLIAPEGVYDIHITDGDTTFTKKSIKLFGTGNVIGAIDEGLVGYTGFGVSPQNKNIEDRYISLAKLPLTLVFVIVVFGLGILIGIERFTKKRAF